MDGVRRWFRLRSVERDVDDELQFHFEQVVQELEQSGATPAAAHEEAQRRFGDEKRYRRELMLADRRGARVHLWRTRLHGGLSAVVQAVRSVMRQPALTVGIVLAFALGIGANVTMYETVDRLLLTAPPHIEDPEGVRRLLVHRSTGLGTEVFASDIAYPDYLDFARTSGFSDVAAVSRREVTIGRGEDAEQVPAVLASANYWRLLGVKPALGRFYTAEEAAVGGAPVVVVSHALWEGRFGGDAGVLGRTIDFGYGAHTIIGVTPEGFTGVGLRPVSLFLPLESMATQMQGEGWAEERDWIWMEAIARVAPGSTVEAAAAEATVHHRSGRAESDAPYDPDATVVAAPVLEAQGPNAPSEAAVARWLLGVAVVVLLIACLNVANLLLARMLRQQRETAIRLALGISRRRLIAQVMLEGLVLGLLGGAAALLLALWGGTLVQRTLLPDIDWSGGPTRTTLLLVVLLSAFAGLLSALVPALQATRSVSHGLRSSAGGIGRSTARVRAGLSMMQAALTVVLLTGAGLYVRSLDRVMHHDYGVDVWDVAYVTPAFFRDAATPEERGRFMDEAVARVRRIPGVESAAVSAGIPFWSAYGYRLRAEDVDSVPRTSTGGPYANTVGLDYFRTVGLDAVQGRLFNEGDRSGAPRVAVVNASFARGLWPDGSALGRCLFIGDEGAPCSEVVGIVPNAVRGRLIEDETHQYYFPLEQAQVDRYADGLLLRIPGDQARVLGRVQTELLAMDPRVRFIRMVTLQEMIAPELRQWQLGSALFTLFGILALAVASIGLYSVLAFDVAQRVREIGLRSALGASTGEIVQLVMSRAARITIAGLLAGGLAAALLAPRLEAMLYEVRPHDPLTFAVVAATLIIVSMVAAGVPAWRAARVDPNVALRAD